LPAQVSACIVNWNTREQLLRCIGALLASDIAERAEIIVVDNASGDGSAGAVAEAFAERVTLVANGENRFYAAANNQAFALAAGEYVLILNPDAYVAPDAISRLITCLAGAPKAAAAAPQLVLPNGTVQRSCRRFPSPWWLFCEATLLRRVLPRTRLFGGYLYGEWDMSTPRAVDQPMASCLLIRSEDLRTAGGFDEAFPMFFNDVDLCFRLADGGTKVLYVPTAKCLHDHAASTRQARAAMVAQSNRSFAGFYRKHYRGRIPWACYCFSVCLIRGGGAVRWAIARFRESLPGRRSR